MNLEHTPPIASYHQRTQLIAINDKYFSSCRIIDVQEVIKLCIKLDVNLSTCPDVMTMSPLAISLLSAMMLPLE